MCEKPKGPAGLKRKPQMLKRHPMTADLGIEVCRSRMESSEAVERMELKGDYISDSVENDFVFESGIKRLYGMISGAVPHNDLF